MAMNEYNVMRIDHNKWMFRKGERHICTIEERWPKHGQEYVALGNKLSPTLWEIVEQLIVKEKQSRFAAQQRTWL